MARAQEFPQLAAQGLTTCPIRGDGNCLFNALSDQIYGDQSRHKEIRSTALEYMRNHPDDFKPFIHVGGERRNPKRKVTQSTTSKVKAATQGQVTRAWDEHMKKMEKGGTWGDHLEITAFTRAYNCDVQIFETDKTLFHRAQDDKIIRPIAYIAYHTWEHYSSIRNIDGPATGLPEVRPKLLSIEKEPDFGYLSSNPPSLRSYSRSGSSSVERDWDGDYEEIDEPRKRRDRRLSKASRASYKSSAGFNNDDQVPMIELTKLGSTVSSQLPPPSHLPLLSNLPPKSELPDVGESIWALSDSESIRSSGTQRIRIKLTTRSQKNAIKIKHSEPGMQKTFTGREVKDFKKAAQKKPHKVRIRNLDEPVIDQEQIVGMKTLYI